MIDVTNPVLARMPSFQQIPSLLGAPIGDLEDVGPGDICLVGYFDDHAEPFPFGSRYAARQLRYAGREQGLVDPADGSRRILDLGDLNVFPPERERNDRALRRQLGAIVEAGGLPIVVGGGGALEALLGSILEERCGRAVEPLRLPWVGSSHPGLTSASAVTLTIDIRTLLAQSLMRPRPLAELRECINALRPGAVRAVHMAGLAPDIDMCGRYEVALGRHCLAFVVDHLLKLAV